MGTTCCNNSDASERLTDDLLQTKEMDHLKAQVPEYASTTQLSIVAPAYAFTVNPGKNRGKAGIRRTCMTHGKTGEIKKAVRTAEGELPVIPGNNPQHHSGDFIFRKGIIQT